MSRRRLPMQARCSCGEALAAATLDELNDALVRHYKACSDAGPATGAGRPPKQRAARRANG